MFEVLANELVAIAVSRLGEDSMPFGIKCLESFVTGKAPSAQLKQCASQGMSDEKEQSMAELRLIMQSRCDLASLAPIVSPNTEQLHEEESPAELSTWSPCTTPELLYSPNMPRKQREWIIKSGKR